MSGVLLFLRSRTAVVLLASVALSLLMPRLAAKLDASGSPLPLAERELLLASVGALLVTAGCQRPDPALERHLRRLVVARAVLWGAGVAAVALAAVAALPADQTASAIRNVVLLAGLSTLVGLAAPPMYAALPAVILWVATLRFGWTINETAASWAVLVKPSETVGAWIPAGAVGTLAWALYALRDMRASSTDGG